MTHDQAYDRLPELVQLRMAHPVETEIQAHVATCPACALRLAELERVTRALHDAREARSASLDDLQGRVLAIPAEHPRRPQGRLRRRLVPAGVGLAAAASLAALALALSRPDTSDAPARFEAQRTITLQPVEGNVTGTVALGRPSGATRVVRLDVRGLPTSGPGSFDLWLIGTRGATRAGSFGPDEDGTCVVDMTTPGDAQWQRIAITPAGAGPHEKVIARA